MTTPQFPALGQTRLSLWLGRGALLAVFAALLTGGAVQAPDALAVGAILSVLALLVWAFLPCPIPQGVLVVPAVLFGCVLAVGLLSAAPVAQGIGRTGLYAPVAGRAFSIAPLSTLTEVAKLMLLTSAFVCGLFSTIGLKTAARSIVGVIVLLTLWSAWALFLHLNNVGDGRLAAPFLSPNTAATLIGCGVILVVGRILNRLNVRMSKKERAYRLSALAAAALLLMTALALTQSRAGVVMTVLSVIGLIVSWPHSKARRDRFRRWIAPACIVLAGLAVLNLGWAILGRAHVLGEDAMDRKAIFAVYADAFLAAPLFGGGLGAAPLISKLSLTSENYQALWNVQSAHNWLLQWLAEGGVLAAVPMFCTIALVLVLVFRGLTVKTAPLLLPLLFVDLLILTHGLVDFAIQIPGVAFLWSFLLGLQIAIACARPAVDKRPEGKPNPSLRSADNVVEPHEL